MPHSSGGGSSSGGSHSGSRGSNVDHIKSSYFPGAHRYARYKKTGTIEYVYSDLNISKKPKGICIWGLILFLPIILASIYITFTGFYPPEKIDTSSYDSMIFVSDVPNFLEDDVALGEKLDEFQELTGISICVKTLYDEEWDTSWSSSLEDYAYDEYLRTFDDEKHWLLVYSEPKEQTGKKDKWAWEGMQGDDTDLVLSSRFADKFTSKVQKALKKGNSFDEAVIIGLDAISPKIMKSAQIDILFGGTLLTLIVLGFAYATCIEGRTGNLTRYIKIEDDNPVEVTCARCGLVYVKGTVPCCPFCYDTKRYEKDEEYRTKCDDEISTLEETAEKYKKKAKKNKEE